MRLPPPRRSWRAAVGRAAALALLAAAATLPACGGDPTAPPPVPPTLTLTAVGLDSLYTGESASVVVRFPQPEDSTDRARVVDVTWASSDTLVAVVSGSQPYGIEASGTVQPRAAGQATITARVRTAAGGVAEASARVTVRGVHRLGVWPDTNVLLPGLTRALLARDVTPAVPVAAATNVAWSSDASSVATVDAEGRVTAVAAGSATITAASGARRASALVVVRNHVAPLAFTSVVTQPAVAWQYGHASCGLVAGGRAYCWGTNERGLLGSTAPMDRCERIEWAPRGGGVPPRSYAVRFRCSAIPTPVEGDLRFAQLSVGRTHACGVTATGHRPHDARRGARTRVG